MIIDMNTKPNSTIFSNLKRGDAFYWYNNKLMMVIEEEELDANTGINAVSLENGDLYWVGPEEPVSLAKVKIVRA